MTDSVFNHRIHCKTDLDPFSVSLVRTGGTRWTLLTTPIYQLQCVNMNRGHIQIHTGQIFWMRCHNIFQLRLWRPTHSEQVLFVPKQNQTASTESSIYLWVCTEVYFQHLFCVWVNDCTHLMPQNFLYNWKDILFSRLQRFPSWCALEKKNLHSVPDHLPFNQ